MWREVVYPTLMIPIASTTLPLVNATLYPIVLIYRSSPLRDKLKEMACRVGALVRGCVERMRIETERLDVGERGEAEEEERVGEEGEEEGVGERGEAREAEEAEEAGEATPLLQ